MDALGLVGMTLFIVATISLAAGITWLVVKITPSEPKKKRTASAESSS